MPSISNLTLCLKVDDEGVMPILRLDPVFTIDGTENVDERGIVCNVNVLLRLRVPIYFPPYVPLNTKSAFIVQLPVPSLLCEMVTVFVAKVVSLTPEDD